MRLCYILENPIKITAVAKILEQAIGAGRLSADYLPHTMEISQRLMEADPTVAKKSAEWLGRLVIRGVIGVPGLTNPTNNPQVLIDNDADINRIKEALSNFELAKPRLPADRRDINQYQDLISLEDTIRTQAQAGVIKSTASFARKAPGSEVIYNDGGVIIYHFTQGSTEEKVKSIQELGMGPPPTSWCTRMEYAVTNGSNYADRYLNQGDIYVVYKNGEPFAQLLSTDISHRLAIAIKDPFHAAKLEELFNIDMNNLDLRQGALFSQVMNSKNQAIKLSSLGDQIAKTIVEDFIRDKMSKIQDVHSMHKTYIDKVKQIKGNYSIEREQEINSKIVALESAKEEIATKLSRVGPDRIVTNRGQVIEYATVHLQLYPTKGGTGSDYFANRALKELGYRHSGKYLSRGKPFEPWIHINRPRRIGANPEQDAAYKNDYKQTISMNIKNLVVLDGSNLRQMTIDELRQLPKVITHEQIGPV